jgi:hypothetical protein
MAGGVFGDQECRSTGALGRPKTRPEDQAREGESRSDDEGTRHRALDRAIELVSGEECYEPHAAKKAHDVSSDHAQKAEAQAPQQRVAPIASS